MVCLKFELNDYAVKISSHQNIDTSIIDKIVAGPLKLSSSTFNSGISTCMIQYLDEDDCLSSST